MMIRCFVAIMTACFLQACAQPDVPSGSIDLRGYWIRDQTGQTLLDPQTSGLAVWRNSLLTVADGSAHISHRLRLVQLDPQSARLKSAPISIGLSARVKQSCFASYLSSAPDFEALVVDPNEDKVLFLVTEDATRSGEYSAECLNLYRHTGSTAFPTLLVRLELQADHTALMTHVRPIQFDPALRVGNHPNDGIEGMVYSPDQTLYLGLEKDLDGQPRVFALNIEADFWSQNGFARAFDPKLRLPRFDSGNHPINGLGYYVNKNREYLVAVARNDEQIWFIDLSKQRDTLMIPVRFFAQIERDPACGAWELMHNASLEGVAVQGHTLWLINDPWKRNYHKNIQCESNRPHYEKMAPLLFKLPIEPSWFVSGY